MQILGSTVKGKCDIKNEIIFDKKYKNIINEKYQICNVEYCEARNFHDEFRYNDDTCIIDIQFDLIIIYEYVSPDNIHERLYGVINEKCSKSFKIKLSSYENLIPYTSMYNTKCFNLYNDIVYETDIGPSKKELSVKIKADIESYLLEDKIIDIKENQGYYLNYDKNTDESGNSKDKNGKQPLNNNIQDNMPQDIREAFLKMIKQVFDEIESKRKIENELKEKENQINFHEYYKETLEKDYQRLCNELNEKVSKVDELKRQLNDNDYVLYNLNERLRKLEGELKMYKKENMSLKEQLREIETQRKEGFVNKIKSYMGN